MTQEMEPIPTIPGAGLGHINFGDLEQSAKNEAQQLEVGRELWRQILNLTQPISIAFKRAVQSQEDCGKFEKNWLPWSRKKTTTWQFVKENLVLGANAKNKRGYLTDLVYKFQVDYRKEDYWSLVLNMAKVDVIDTRSKGSCTILLDFSRDNMVGATLSWMVPDVRGGTDNVQKADAIVDIVREIVVKMNIPEYIFCRKNKIRFILEPPQPSIKFLGKNEHGYRYGDRDAFDYFPNQGAFWRRTQKHNKFADSSKYRISVDAFVKALGQTLGLIPIYRLEGGMSSPPGNYSP